MSRNSRLVLVAAGAFVVALAFDIAVGFGVTSWAMSGPAQPPEDCADIGCQFSTDEFGQVVALIAWVVLAVGLGIGGTLIALTTTLLGLRSKWQPRAATGTFSAIGLGIAAGAIGPLIGLAIITALD
jgi:hypothetical protein